LPFHSSKEWNAGCGSLTMHGVSAMQSGERNHGKQFASCQALTLIELLVVITIIAIVASLSLVAVQSVRKSGDRAAAIASLRQIGAGIHLFAADHDGTLPGPLWPGQIPVFDSAREGRLARDLLPYLQIPKPRQPEVIDLFVPPAFRRVIPSDQIANSRTFVMNMSVPDENGGMINPWGSLAKNDEQPMKLPAVPQSAWVLSDADQQHPRVAGASWQSSTPPEPVHGENRQALFFDGRAEPVSVERLR
jgi:prepilin-type N-terminal cleavage/methylation domain-containing protein